MTPKISFSSKDRVILLLFVIAFLVVNLGVVSLLHIRPGGDGPRYVTGAEQLLQGELPSNTKARFFLGYVGMVAFFQALGLGLSGVVGFQIFLYALRLLALFDLGRRLGGKWASWIAVGLTLLNFDLVKWNAYILTDSLYTSFVVLSVLGGYLASERKGYWYAAGALLVGFTALLRPNGWVLVPIVIVFWLIRSGLSRTQKQWIFGGTATLTVAAGILTISWLAMTGLERSTVLARITTTSLTELLELMQQMGYQTWRSFIHIRDFFSPVHNALILIYLLPTYLFGIIGLVVSFKKPLAPLLLAVLVGHFLVVGLSYAASDARYLLFILPLINVFSACGVVWCFDEMKAMYSERRIDIQGS